MEDFDSFLMQRVFADLTNLNTGFDHPAIYHLGPEDFGTVIDRCQRMHIRVHGIEVFLNNIEFIKCVIAPDDGYSWARQVVEEYRGIPEIAFSATYSEPLIAG